MIKDMVNPTDWLQINIKFRGKCYKCGKDVKPGQALWSKSTKAVKHLDCHFRNIKLHNTTALTNTNPGEPMPYESKKEYSTPQKKSEQTIEFKCYICGNKSVRSSERDPGIYNDYKDTTQAYICPSCLKRDDAFEAYQESFVQKMSKYLK